MTDLFIDLVIFIIYIYIFIKFITVSLTDLDYSSYDLLLVYKCSWQFYLFSYSYC